MSIALCRQRLCEACQTSSKPPCFPPQPRRDHRRQQQQRFIFRMATIAATMTTMIGIGGMVRETRPLLGQDGSFDTLVMQRAAVGVFLTTFVRNGTASWGFALRTLALTADQAKAHAITRRAVVA